MSTPTRAPGRPAGLTGDDLLAVAREVFMERGYAGASMDEVARRARISKASLYREHPSKTALYSAVVRHWAEAGRGAMRPALERLIASDDLREGLVDLALAMRRGILSPPVLHMRRLVTSEALTHPEVAAGYLEESWNANIATLADAIGELDAQGRLRVPDARTAADQFTWLVIGSALNARLLTADDHPDPSPVSNAVDLFLAGYGAEGGGVPS